MSDRPHVLLVDDDEDLRVMLRHVLAGTFLATAVRGGAEAIRMLDEGGFEALVLDLMMPGVDGFEVLHHVRSNESTRDLPVVVLTARQGRDWEASTDRLGADAHLTKPFDTRALIDTLQRLLAASVEDRWRDRSDRVAPLRPIGARGIA